MGLNLADKKVSAHFHLYITWFWVLEAYHLCPPTPVPKTGSPRFPKVPPIFAA